MPALKVLGVALQISTGLIELIVEFQVQVMGLGEQCELDGIHGAGELAVGFIDVVTQYHLSR